MDNHAVQRLSVLRGAEDGGVAIPRSEGAFIELPSAVALKNAWLPITEAQKDGSWIWAVMEGVHAETGKPFEPVLVRWDDGRWFEPYDDTGCLEHFWQLSHYVPLPARPATAR